MAEQASLWLDGISPGFANFRALYYRLGEELDRLETWTQRIQDENRQCTGLLQDAGISHTGTDVSPIVTTLAVENPDLAVNDKFGMSEEQTSKSQCEDLNNISIEICDTERSLMDSASLESALPDVVSPMLPRHSMQSQARFSQTGLQAEAKGAGTNRIVESDEDFYELKSWFRKLIERESEQSDACARAADHDALGAEFLQSLHIQTDGDYTRGEQSVTQAIRKLNHAVMASKSNLFHNAGVRRLSDTHATNQKDTIGFDAFCELINWYRVEEHLGDKEKVEALKIREVLIRNSVDELILEASGLSRPKKVKSPSIARSMIEPVVGSVVILNALTIGISADHPWDGWETMEVIYTLFFLMEAILKTFMDGFRFHWCGPDRAWNWFDALIIALAMFDLAVTWSGKESVMGSFALMRLARLAKISRLLRLIRLIRLRFFKELLLLVKGVAAGMRTIAWAFVLMATLVYILGIFLRQTIGVSGVQIGHTVLFHSVPSSMFNVFRCFIGDCSLPDGTPLLAHLYRMHGYTFGIPWALVEMFVTFGVFNLIMAVFVENVQENAKMKRQLTRDDERARVITQMRDLVLIFGGVKNVSKSPGRMTSQGSNSITDSAFCAQASILGNSKDLEDYETDTRTLNFQFGGIITREMFNKVIREPVVNDILDDLEVHVADRTELFDLLDADGSKTVDVSELIHGILKLRSGGADKSDIVATILGIRSLQRQLSNFIETAFAHQEGIRADLRNQIMQLQGLKPNVKVQSCGASGCVLPQPQCSMIKCTL